jgi:sarcosine oxidase subunit alpha
VDASTLGKIEVCGPDAGNFLNRLYPGNWDKLKMGAARYALMLRDDGYIFDDGIIARLSEDRYHVTTTTGGAARVLAHMEDYLQTEWPNLEAWITPITEQWAVIPVQGPKARDVIAPLVEGIDLGSAAFPHNQVREGAIAGIDTRLFRVSFTGELGFEINVPSDYGRYVWEVVWAEAQKYGGVAYGTETLHVLRAEKGYIIIGQETDGSVTPDDVGLSWVLPKHNRDFVGRRGLLRPDLAAAGRRQLVGIITDDPSEVLEEGAQVIDTRDPPRGTPALGHVTSSYWSSTLGRSIALALVSNGRARIGSGCFVTGLHGSHPAKIVSHVFYDPKGQRLHG